MAAKVDQDLCTGCGACVPACPFDAVSIQGGKAQVDQDRCAGCANDCPNDAIGVG